MLNVQAIPSTQAPSSNPTPQSKPEPLLTDIEGLNRHHAFVMNGGKAMVMNFCDDPSQGETITFSSQADFRALYATRNTLVFEEDGSSHNVPLANQWWGHQKRRQYAGLVFMPGKPREVPPPKGGPYPYFNLFGGWPIEPKDGDCSKFWKHVRDVICAGDETRYLYVRRWMAHAIQRPDEMPGTALVIVGEPGTGKGTLATTFGELFGKHFTHVIQMDHLLGKFNGHMSESILVFADEVTWGGNKQNECVLRGMVTEKTMVIERKGMDSITCASFRRFIFASNEDWAVAICKNDRRYLVLETSSDFRGNTAYFEELRAHMANGGLQALMYDLLHEDLSNFNVRKKPEGGAAEAAMFVLSQTGPARFWYEFLYEATEDLWPKVVNRQALYSQYVSSAPKGERTVTASVFGRALSKMCPDVSRHSSRNDGKNMSQSVGTPVVSSGSRNQTYEFPPLERARAGYEKFSGMGKALWEDA